MNPILLLKVVLRLYCSWNTEQMVDPSGIEPVSLRETFFKSFQRSIQRHIYAYTLNHVSNLSYRILVDPSGIEPLTSSLPAKRSPS